MVKAFRGNCRPVLIGSLPLKNHQEASEIVLHYTPEIPIWVQLPAFKKEGMITQFLPGFPGVVTADDRIFIDTDSTAFERDLLQFYEDYIALSENDATLSNSRFALNTNTAGGFFALLDNIKKLPVPPIAVKGQVTGPITFCTGLSDQHGRALFYNEQLRDAAVKHLSMKAKWEVTHLAHLGCPVIIFFDEPALAGFGSSEFISITRDQITACLNEVFEAVRQAGGLVGIHICANTDWSMVLETGVDIVNFDAYSYFDRFALYPDQIVRFFKSGRILAWGIVPTLDAEAVEKETTASLQAAWDDKSQIIEAMGITRSDILAQSLITPSCGAGSLSVDHAMKVLRLTKELSASLRKRI